VTASVAPGLQAGNSVAWGDYDNDGRLDILIGNQIWHNTGSNFVNVTATVAPSLPSVTSGSARWGDYDNDGRLDILITGNTGTGLISQIWRNFTSQTNNVPAAPTGLAMTSSTNGALLSWNAATDAQTPSTGLTYNVRAGTTPGGIDLLAPNANPMNGLRSVPAMGNAQMRLFLPLAGVTNGQTVYWSVQAVDTAFAGGPFATECSVVSIPTMRFAANATLSWYPLTWGWHLQESPDLTPDSWSDSPIGEVNPATIPSTNTAKFYRLFNP
jgi:hypothetical protein